MEPTKHDRDKPRWELLPFKETEQIVDVLTHGAKKYAPDNWKNVVTQGERRYFAACMRHLAAWRQGQSLDPESGLPHLAHAICSLFFELWNDNRQKATQTPTNRP